MSSGTQHLLNEQILAAWEDENGTPHQLGTCSIIHRESINFFMKEGIEEETGRSYVYFSLAVGTTVGTKYRRKEIRMVFLPYAFNNLDSPLVFESLHISNIANSSVLQESDLTKSGHIIRVRFDLASRGFVIQPKSRNSIKLTTTTSNDLVRGFRSLSTALSFDVYMRHSTYATSYLLNLNIHLYSNTISLSPLNLTGLFEGRDAIPIKWPDLEPDKQQISQEKLLSPPPPPPPFHDEGYLLARVPLGSPTIQRQSPPTFQRHSRVQVPQSPPNTRTEKTTLPATEMIAAETPHGTPIFNSPIPPTASQTSDHSIINIGAEWENHREGPESEIGPDDDYYATLQAREMSLDREAAAFDAEGLENKIDSDEEHYAALCARELSPITEIAPPMEIALATEIALDSRLSSEFTDWLVGATTIHSDIYKHGRLASRIYDLAYYVRTQNTKAFHSTMIWCSTILFCDPLDSCSIPELWNGPSRSLILDMAGIIQWSNTSCRSPEMCLSDMRGAFLKLGGALRAIAELPSQRNLDEHARQRARCINIVYQKFTRKPSISR